MVECVSVGFDAAQAAKSEMLHLKPDRNFWGNSRNAMAMVSDWQHSVTLGVARVFNMPLEWQCSDSALALIT